MLRSWSHLSERICRNVIVSLLSVITIAMWPEYLNHANAFEEDIHYYATFALALTAGWSWEESEAIADANIAMDTNEHVVAKLHSVVDTLKGFVALEQAQENYVYHCFSRKPDDRDTDEPRNEDVRTNLDDHLDLVNGDENIISRVHRIGAYLHCQQDSWSHNGFGGKTFGHVWSSFFGANPDRPSERPIKTRHAMLDAYKRLRELRTDPSGNDFPYVDDIVTLIKALETNIFEPNGERDVSRLRYHCNKLNIEYWLYDTVVRNGHLGRIPASFVEKLSPSNGSWQRECLENRLDRLVSEIVVIKIPELKHLGLVVGPKGLQYPNSTSHAKGTAAGSIGHNFAVHSIANAASPVAGDETAHFDYRLDDVSVTEKEQPVGNRSTCLYRIEATVRNEGPNISPQAILLAAVIPGPTTSIPNDEYNKLFEERTIGPLFPGQAKYEQIYIRGNHLCTDWEPENPRKSAKNAFWVRIQAPPEEGQPKVKWNDSDITNNIADTRESFKAPLPGSASFIASLRMSVLSASGVFLSLIGCVFMFTKQGDRRYITLRNLIVVCMGTSALLITLAWFLQQLGVLGNFIFFGERSNPVYSPIVPANLFSFNLLNYGMIASATLWATLKSEVEPLRLSIFVAIWLVLGYGPIAYLNLPTIGSYLGEWVKPWIVADYANCLSLYLIPGVTAIVILWLLKENDDSLNTGPIQLPSHHTAFSYCLFWLAGLCLLNSTHIVEGMFGVFASKFAWVATLSAILTGLLLKLLIRYQYLSDDWDCNLWSFPVIGLISAFPSAGFGHPIITAVIVGSFGVVITAILKTDIQAALVIGSKADLVIIQTIAGTWGLAIAGYASSQEYNQAGFNGDFNRLNDQVYTMIVAWVILSIVASAILFLVGGGNTRTRIKKKLRLFFGSMWDDLKNFIEWLKNPIKKPKPYPTKRVTG
jgi:ammonia channel protein AmtB